MAIKKDYVVDDRATAVNYWRYADLLSFEVLKPPHPKPGPVAKIALHGYVTKESRDAAKENGRSPDHVCEFLISNWIDVVPHLRPATVEEKKKDMPKYLDRFTEEQWEEYPYSVLESEELVPHNDYDRYRKAFNTPDEAKVTYEILKQHPNSRSFFLDAEDA